jgi:hypothetical protein
MIPDARTHTYLKKSSTAPSQSPGNTQHTKCLQEEVAAATPKQRQQWRGKKNRKPILENKPPPQYRITITTTIAPAPAPEEEEEEEEETATWVRSRTGLTLLAPPILAFLRNALNDRSPIRNSSSCKNNKALRKKLEALGCRCCFRVLFAR